MEYPEVSIKLVRENTVYSSEPIKDAESIVKFIASHYCDYDREVVLLLNFDNAFHLINFQVAAIGQIDQCSINARELLKCTLLSNASGVVLVHNHPGGDPHPSPNDIEMTNTVKEAYKFFGITLHDHIIVTPQGLYFSLAEKGMMI